MENIETKFEGGIFTASLSGHIDSTNSAQVEEALKADADGKEIASFIVDAKSLDYISSAGLRVILSLKKQYKDFKVINVKSEVYEVFDMTGFTQMMEIQKAYKTVSIDGGEVIGEGKNGIVYRISPDTIVKVYKNPDALEEIKNERELAKKAFVNGIPTSISYDVVQVDGKYASMFEMLEADNISKKINREPDKIDEFAKASVDLLKKIHSVELKPGEMVEAKSDYLKRAERLQGHLAPEVYQKLCELVKAIPENYHINHGDYHIKNQMFLKSTGELMLIDMDTLCLGDPVFDFGSLFNAYVGREMVVPGNNKEFLGITAEQGKVFWNKTLEFYFGTDDKAQLEEIERRAMIVGELRLMAKAIKSYNGTDYGEKQIASSKALLEDAVPKTSELTLASFQRL
ncbi:MAG: anti-sigma factor antagonist [Treponema sp.]|nr:anti-sigma factor antagonist [Treponema sp.]MEE3434504.1 anti-sigma factor antagonist [Treponema sp.]